MEAAERLDSVVSRELERLGYELVKLEPALRGRRKVIRIFIDHPERSVTIDDCVKVTKAVGFVLDGEDSITGPYNLEVSSPGIDRPLTQSTHFKRFIGKQAKIEYHTDADTKETVIGRIVDSNDTRVMLSVGNIETEILFDRVVRANLHGEKWDIPRVKRRKGRTRSKRH
ncbi:MAG: ribosome maturation factor RimP [bacterium]|nr:MAG: ribosome maturation factor RimP [bacterium]